MKAKRTPKQPACTHSATRLYAWQTPDKVMNVCCCQCGAVLRGGVTLNSEGSN